MRAVGELAALDKRLDPRGAWRLERLILEQARVLYRFWPETLSDTL